MDQPPAEPGPDATRRSRGGSRRRPIARSREAARAVLGRRVVQGAVIGVVAVVATVGATGGFAEVEIVDVPEIEPGTVMDLGPYTARVDSFFVTDRVATFFLDADRGGDAWLGIRVHIENTWDRTMLFNDASLNVIVDDVEIAPDALWTTEVLVRDGSTLPYLHPGLGEDLLVLWPIDATLADSVGDEISVRLDALEYSYGEVLGSTEWRLPQPVAVVTLTRDDDLPPQVIEPEEDE